MRVDFIPFRQSILVAIATVACLAVVRAEEPEFPYDATVSVDSAAVHSGNGEQFYVTNQLRRGTVVRVHRHDPDGWRMIAPPEGAFSLIPSDSFEARGETSAVIVAPEVVSRVGSHAGDNFAVEQVPLRFGTRVELLPAQKAPESWVAIQPPRGEYRWVRGDQITPRPTEPPDESKPSESEEQFDADGFRSESPAMQAEQVLSESEATLKRLDSELASLKNADPAEWPLEALSLEYQRLKRTGLELVQRVDDRLAQIAELKQVQNQRLGIATANPEPSTSASMPAQGAAEIPAVSSPPEKTPAIHARAAETPNLATLEPDHQARRPQSPAEPPDIVNKDASPFGAMATDTPSGSATIPARPAQPVNDHTPETSPPGGNPAPAIAGTLGDPGDFIQPEPSAQMSSTSPQANPAGGNPGPGTQRFDAVGFIQKAIDAPAGAPQFVLVSAEGRIQAYLRDPTQGTFEAYVGYPMGVDGRAQRVPHLQLPLIEVERLTPVRF